MLNYQRVSPFPHSVLLLWGAVELTIPTVGCTPFFWRWWHLSTYNWNCTSNSTPCTMVIYIYIYIYIHVLWSYIYIHISHGKSLICGWFSHENFHVSSIFPYFHILDGGILPEPRPNVGPESTWPGQMGFFPGTICLVFATAWNSNLSFCMVFARFWHGHNGDFALCMVFATFGNVCLPLCMVFATFWHFNRSCGFLESSLGFHLVFHLVFHLGFH